MNIIYTHKKIRDCLGFFPNMGGGGGLPITKTLNKALKHP